jgi:hypothetical protein
LLTGTLKTYAKAAASGRTNHQRFCANCASPIYSTLPGVQPVIFNLRLGTARQRDQLRPKRQLWCLSAQEWAVADSSKVRLDQQ